MSHAIFSFWFAGQVTSPPSGHLFQHWQTVRFKPPADLVVNGKSLLNALKVPKEDLVGLVPLYGGKCFDMKFNSAESASRVSPASVNLGGSQYPIALLGVRSIHVSVFVSVEFPDELLVDTLAAYGELKSRIAH